MSEEGAAKPVRRFRVWIRRRVDPQGPYAIRFEVTDGKGILRVARPGVLIDPPARPAGVEERLTAAQVRSSRFLHVWDGGRYRQGHLLARLEEGLIDALPAERWVELVPEMDSNTAMLVLPKVLRPDTGRVDDEPTWPRREGAEAANRPAETVRAEDPQPPPSPAPASSHDAPDSRRAQPAPRPLGRADAPPVPARGFETWDLGPPMVGGDPDGFDDEHTVLMRSVVPPVAPVTRPAATPGTSTSPKPSATPAAHASPPPAPRVPTPPLILPPLPAFNGDPDEEMTTLEVAGIVQRNGEDDAEMAAFTIDEEPLEAHPGDEDEGGRESPRVPERQPGDDRGGRHDLVRGQISGAVTFLPGERPEVEIVEVLESLEAGDESETVEDVDDPWGASVRAEPARGPSVTAEASAPPVTPPAPQPAPQPAAEAPLALHERNTTLVRFLRRRIAADRVRILALESRVAQLEAQVAGRPASEG